MRRLRIKCKRCGKKHRVRVENKTNRFMRACKCGNAVIWERKRK